MLIFKVTFKHQ